jgi:crossover junction endodeoxyribonuclease RusA
MSFLTVTIPGDPVAKGRPRLGKNGHAFTPERTRMAEKAVTDLCIGLMDGQSPLEGAVSLSVVFHCGTRRRTDADNLLKLVTDAMNQVVFADDSQIEEFHVRLYRGVGKANAKTLVQVSILS